VINTILTDVFFCSENDESFMLPVLAHLSGKSVVSQDGRRMVYHFPVVSQPSVGRALPKLEAIPNCIQEPLWKFSWESNEMLHKVSNRKKALFFFHIMALPFVFSRTTQTHVHTYIHTQTHTHTHTH